MQKAEYKKTSVNIEKNLYLMSIAEGIELTAFVNNCLSLFFDVPPDPHQQIIKDKSEYSVLRLKEKYLRDITEIVKDFSAQQSITEKAKEKEQELIQFGDYLKRSSAYPVFLNGLKKHDMDDDILALVTNDINRMDGHQYEATQVWNKAIDWYRKYGEATS